MTSGDIRYTHIFDATCHGCGTGCGIKLSKHRNGSLLLEGDPDHPINKGNLCRKAHDLKYSINDEGSRLENALVRYNKEVSLRPSSWTKTMERVVAVLKTFIEKFGPESIAFYLSDTLLNEEYFLIQKLIKKNIGSNQLFSRNTYNNDLNLSIHNSFGREFKFAEYSDLEVADCLFIVSNIADSHPIIWSKIVALKAAEPEIRIIAIGALDNQVNKIADLHLDALPGTENLLYKAIGRCLIENGETDKGAERSNPEVFKELKREILKTDQTDSAVTLRIRMEDIEKACDWISRSRSFVSVWTEGDEIFDSSAHHDSLKSLINLHFVTGKIDKLGTGPMLLMQSSNARGNWEMQKIFNTAFKSVATPTLQHSKTSAYKANEDLLRGLNTGRIKCLWVVGAEIFKEFPNPAILAEGLRKAKFVVYQGAVENSEILSYADAVLPAASRLEKEGTTFNASGGLSFTPRVKLPVGNSLPDGVIISKFAKLMGYAGFDYANYEEIFHELLHNLNIASRTPSKLNYDNLRKYKVAYQSHQQRSFKSIDGKMASALPIKGDKKSFIQVSEGVSSIIKEDFPYYLQVNIFGKKKSYHQLITSDVLQKYPKDTFVLINTSDAKALNIASDDLIEITSSLGEARAKTIISQNVKKGAVLVFINTEQTSKDDLSRWELLLGGFSKEINKESVQRVQLKKYRKERQKIVIIGAGAAAYGFVKAYRKVNKFDEIIIFSKEITPFYDRFMLPEYLSGFHLWNQLLKMDKKEEASFNIVIHRGMSILKIDRKHKNIVDAENNKTAYDILIIATGSRAAKPKNTPNKVGIFTMRSRNDAENFRNNVPSNADVVIVGGGILGLEVAASLREKGAKVTIIQRTSRFLDRQLDTLGSQILHDEMIELGCDIYYNDEVQLYFGQTTITGVGLKSGRKIACQAMVIAIGNIPNIHLAKECGLEWKLGILVNAQLQTKDPYIFAIGEVAELNGKLYNFPLAAEEQAAVAANFIHGDRNSHYHTSVLRNAMKLQGQEICSIGLVEAPDDKNYEEIIVLDKKLRYYKKLIIYRDMLVGAILIGDKTEFDTLGDLIANKVKLKEKRAVLLRDPPNGSQNPKFTITGEMGNIEPKYSPISAHPFQEEKANDQSNSNQKRHTTQ